MAVFFYPQTTLYHTSLQAIPADETRPCQSGLFPVLWLGHWLHLPTAWLLFKRHKTKVSDQGANPDKSGWECGFGIRWQRFESWLIFLLSMTLAINMISLGLSFLINVVRIIIYLKRVSLRNKYVSIYIQYTYYRSDISLTCIFTCL
jgi:hypothetical protein